MNDAIEYIETLRNNSLSLFKFSLKLNESNKLNKQHFLRSTSLILEEFNDLKEDLSILEKDIGNIAKEVLLVLSKFQKIALKPHLARVEEKLDFWQPHNLISRKEFIASLEREL